MTNGPFLKKLFVFALPLMFMGLLQLLYNTADTVIIGRFAGKEALAAVGATGSLVNLILNIFIGLSTGSGVVQGRHIGAGDEEKMSKCTHTAMLLGLICGFIVGCIGFFFSGKMLVLMKAPSDVIGLSTLYLKIYFLGAPGSLVYNYGASLLRAMGDTKRPLYVLLFSGLVNIVLNIILVVPFRMGVSGVAIATIVSQYISAAFIVRFLVSLDNPCRLYINKLAIYKRELLDIIRIGLPAGIQGALFSISNVIIQSNVNSFGSSAMAGIAAGSNYDGYIYVCTNAFTQATMNFSSQNIGARKYYNVSEIFRRCLIIAAAIGLVLSFAGFFFSEQIVWLFSKDPEVMKIGAARLAQVMPFYVFCSLQDLVAGQVRGMGKSVEPMIISVFGTCVLRILWILTAMPVSHTLVTLYWAYPISWAATFFMMVALYFYAKKKMLQSAAAKASTAA